MQFNCIFVQNAFINTKINRHESKSNNHPSFRRRKSILFYRGLELKLIVKALPHYARFVCKDGGSTFSLHQVNELPKGDGVWIYFEVENLDVYVNQLIAKGLVFEEMPNDKTWLWRECRMKDLDNN